MKTSRGVTAPTAQTQACLIGVKPEDVPNVRTHQVRVNRYSSTQPTTVEQPQ